MRLARLPLLVLTAIPTIASLALACGGEAPPPEVAAAPAVSSTPPAPPPAPAVSYDSSLTGVDANALDRSASPCDDFYQFACGGWMKATPIPDDQSRWVRSFSVIAEDNKKALRAILERDAAGDTKGDAYGQQLGDFWTSCMDEAGIEQRGASDLKPELKLIAAVHDGKSLAAELAHLHLMGVDAAFRVGSQPDDKDSAHDIAVIAQGGLGLPERDFYFRDDPHAKDIRAAYEAHVAATFELLGDKHAAAVAAAKTVMKVETALADASMKRVDMRDPQKVYHHTTIAELQAMAPKVAWDGYFAGLGFPALSAFNVKQPDFVKKVDAMTRSVPMAQWKTYLRWHLAAELSPWLSQKFVDEWFKFSQVLRGTKALPPRWKRCVEVIDGSMGEALAQPYVKAYLGDDGKQEAAQMVSGIEASMKADLDGLAWMDEATRAAALGKLAAIDNKIGYPSQWRNYDAVTITKASLVANVAAAAAFEAARETKKAGQPVDKNEWDMTPPTVNAYYEPTLNEMVFPAGILQPPFYAATQSPATNFGAIGMVVGHELTHGFDDEGRQYDAQGNLRDWWSATVGAEFDRRASCVEKQYDEYVPIDDLHVKGKLTLGENLADLGGMKLAYASFERAEKEHPATPPSLGGFTPEQTFFLGFAQAWCTNVRPEEARLRLQTDPHSPAMFRVIGPLSNLPEFAGAFQCKAGDKMVRGDDKRCVVW
jgi:putative endopeptidase